MSERLPVSVLLITHNEERRLPGWLAGAGWAAEVVVVDSCSRDRTRDLASAAGAQVYEHPFEGFGAQRQFALRRCSQPWVLWLDADERLDGEALESLAEAVRSPRAGGYRIRRQGYFLGKRIRFCGWRNERVLRFFRREGARFNDKPVHESVVIPGPEGRLAGAIHHHSYERWVDCRDKLLRYAEASARRAHEGGRRASALDLLWRPPARFLRQYLLQLGFLDGAHGVLLCALSAGQVLLKYAELWSLTRERP